MSAKINPPKSPFSQSVIRSIVITALGAGLAACGGGGGAGSITLPGENSQTTPVPSSSPTVNAAKLNILWDKASVKTGGKDKATLTITALNSSNGILPGARIQLSANSGILSQSVVTTDAAGQAVVTYSAGADLNNRTETIAITSGNISTSTAINTVGTTLALNVLNGSTSITSNGKTNMEVTVKDGEEMPAANVEVSFASSGTGSVSFSPATAKTDSSGKVVTQLTGGASGTATVTASSLGVNKTSTITVSGGTNSFSITNPAGGVVAATTNSSLPVTVASTNANTVVFVTTLGNWSNGSKMIEVPVVAGAATATLNNTITGTATVQAYNKASPATSSSFQVVVSSPVSLANSIALQVLPAVVAPSTGLVKNSVTLTAKVYDAANKPIANAPVTFEILNSLGGGEYIAPAATISGDGTGADLALGEAKATFFSGSLSSGQSNNSVQLVAKVLLPDGSTKASPPTTITIGGTAGSVSIGQSTKIESSADNTYYTLPMSVLVADSNGSPMANTTVNLSAWPIAYSIGSGCSVSATFKAEDLNENLFLNAGEDGYLLRLNNTSFVEIPLLSSINGTTPTSISSVANGILSPSNSAAGTIPSKVTTDANGVASFKYTYLKGNALWTVVRLRASTLVQGTETSSESIFRLSPAKADVDPDCFLPNSPYNSIIRVQ